MKYSTAVLRFLVLSGENFLGEVVKISRSVGAE